MIDDAAIADGRHLRLMVTSPRRAPIIEVQVEVGAAITAAAIGGQVLDLADFAPATTGELIFYASGLAADGFVLDLTLAAVGPVRITLADMSDGLPGPARVRPPIRCPRRGRPWMERWSEAGWSSEPGISQNKDSPKLAHKSHDTSHSSYRLPRVARAMTVLGIVILMSLLGLAGLLVVWSPGQPAPLVVLLVLHGGPGMPTFILYTTHPTGLEQEFKAVWWEQRCADMSFASDIPAESMTVDQLIADTIAVTNYLRDGFGQDKIYLLGHSWGSCLGIQVAAKASELFHAYIGMGQLSGNPRIFSGVRS